MNFAELVTRFTAQGFDYLQTSEAENYLNDAYLVDICGAADWPFLEATITGTAPLSIPELGAVIYVVDSTQGTKLTPRDPRGLSDIEPSLTNSGTPRHYYVTGSGTLNVYPLSTSEELQVRYLQIPPRLTGTAVPVFPERFHSIIVDGAVARAYENSDDFELSQSAEAKFNGRLQKMEETLMNVYRDGPQNFVEVTDPLAF